MKRGLALHSLATARAVRRSEVSALKYCIFLSTLVKNDERYWRHDWSDMSGKVKRSDKAGNGCNTREMPIFRWEWIVSISSFFTALLAQKCFTQLCDSSLECRPPSPIGVSARSKWVHFQGNWNAAFPKVVMASKHSTPGAPNPLEHDTDTHIGK